MTPAAYPSHRRPRKRKLAHGHAQTTRLQRLGITVEARPAEVTPTAVVAAPARLATIGRHGIKQLVARVSGEMRASGIEAKSRWNQRPAGCANSEEAPGDGGSSRDRVRAYSGEAEVAGQPPEPEAKRIKVGTTLHFPIHEVAVQHSIAASDSEEDQPISRADSTWWNQVEAQIDDDLRADRKWWSEIEDAIRSDEVVESNSSIREVSGAIGKRELCLFRCTGDATRVKTPG